MTATSSTPKVSNGAISLSARRCTNVIALSGATCTPIIELNVIRFSCGNAAKVTISSSDTLSRSTLLMR
jgi:hypothetical protein